MRRSIRLPRRDFMATIALPALIPSGVLAAAGRPGANERLVVGTSASAAWARRI